MNKRNRLILLITILMLILVGCNKKEVIEEEEKAEVVLTEAPVIEEIEEPKLKELSDSEKEELIIASNVESFIPEGTESEIQFVYLTGKEMPEIVCTYSNSSTWENKLIILEYDDVEKTWGIKFENEDIAILSFLGIIDIDNDKELALYQSHSGGTAGIFGVDIIKYDEINNKFIIELESSYLNYAQSPYVNEEEKTIVFEGFSHTEVFKWNGQGFNSEITKDIIDINPDVEIHYTTDNNGLVLKDYNLYDDIRVEIGDIVAFINDDYTKGEPERFGSGEGFEHHEKAHNYLIVKDDKNLDISVRIAADWYEINFKVLKEYTSSLAKKKLIEEDYLINVNNHYIGIYGDNIKNFMSAFGKVEVTEIERSPNNEDIILYEYIKDGVSIYYYDDPNDKNYPVMVYAIVIQSPKYPTYRGLKVGDSIDKMRELYGEMDIYESDEFDIYQAHSSLIDGYLDLFIRVDPKTRTIVSYNVATSL